MQEWGQDDRRETPAPLPEGVAVVAEALTLMGQLAGARGAIVAIGPAGATLRTTHPDGALSDSGHDDETDLQSAIIDLVRSRFEGHLRRSLREDRWRVLPWRRGTAQGAIVLAADGDPMGRIAAWAERALGATDTGAESALGALGEGLVLAGPDGLVRQATGLAAELLGTAPAALVGRSLGGLLGPGTTTDLAAVQPSETLQVPFSGPLGEALEARVERGTHDQVVVRVSRAADREARATRRDQLVAAIRHEIRTPLTVLRGVTSMLEEEPDMEVEDRVGFLASLRKETHRVITIVEDLLTIARMEAARTLTRLQLVDLVVIASEIANEVRAFCDQNGVALALDLAAEPLIVRADRPLLEQLGRSMIGHILRSAPRGTRVILRATEEIGVACLELEDDGPGVSPEDAADIFTSFRRSTSTGKYAPGVGIGLAVAKRIADAHGWGLTHESSGDVNRLTLRAPLDTSET